MGEERYGSRNADIRQLELGLLSTLPRMLLTVAIFSLSANSLRGVLGGLRDTSGVAVAAILLSFLAAFCLFATALLIDSAFDELEIKFQDRWECLGQGYAAFCFVLGVMTAFVPILYAAQNESSYFSRLSLLYLPFVGAGFSVSMKMMVYDDSWPLEKIMVGFLSKAKIGFWGQAMVVFYIASICVLIFCR